MGISSKIVSRMRRAVWAGVAIAAGLLAKAETASAQEILLTGPLAGAPAVRKLKLYRQGRFEVAPAFSFTLLDEYQRQIFVGARINYNLTDWFALGAWGAFSPGPFKITTALAENIQTVNKLRQNENNVRAAQPPPNNEPTTTFRATQFNLGPDFTKQLGTIDWIVAPQITLVPFRGKIAIFQSIYADTDLYFFVGPAFAGLKERGDCGPKAKTGLSCNDTASFQLKSRTAIAPTFGLGFSFYVNKWNAFGFEWRAVPFSRNTGGFDNHGGGPDQRFPDYSVTSDDREFKFNQMVTVSYGFYFPTMYRQSE
jgi:hypothetical protein